MRIVTSCQNLLLVLLAAALSVNPAAAQKNKKKKDTPTTEKTETPANKKSIAETVKTCKSYEGLFTLYQDTITGSTYMKVKKDQVGKEYIYFSHSVDGPVLAGHFRGNFRENKIFSVRKYFNRIELVTENTSYYFDKTNALSRASEANINKPVLVSQLIMAEDTGKGEYLIKADDIFLTENLHQIKPSPSPNAKGNSFSLGSLSKEKTKYVTVKNYPLNTDVVVEYVYENLQPSNYGSQDITDARFVSIKLQHSIIEVPQNSFTPRSDDPRIGYFTEQVEDMTSASATPYRDVINRWHLEKKDKNAAVSEPVEPITWWIENTTPIEFRETIKAAGLAWNEAFEKAGFKNAVKIEVQPDDANWDAGDIRYNVLRWTSSPNPPFGGYGPSFTNPRTGQILGADIMLEYIFVTNRLKQEKLFEAAALNLDQPMTEQPDKHACYLTDQLHHQTLFGLQALLAASESAVKVEEYVKSSLYYLVLHEMGHTLGLNHNMKASQLYSPAEINNRELTSRTGLTGSVMDYPAVNLSADPGKQGQYFTEKPGPYDMWAIEYGYSAAMDDRTSEQKRLAKILTRSSEPALMFGNDADDMRSPGMGLDPRVMIGDLSNDAISYSIDRMKLANKLTEGLKDRYVKPGQSYHEMRHAYLILTGEYQTAARVISRYVGGVYVDRSFAGESSVKPFTPVSRADQKRAITALNDYLFAPGSFTAGTDLYNYLQMQRRGFNFFGSPEDPKVHDRALNMHKEVLQHLLHPNVMKRLTDASLYGNEYPVTELITDLNTGIFKTDLTGDVNTFRQNLQTEYVLNLRKILESDAYDYRSRAAAFAGLKSVKSMLSTAVSANADTKAHRDHLLFVINKALDPK